MASEYAPITEGPFFISLKNQDREGAGTEHLGRLVVGGPDGSSQRLPQIMQQINSLPDGLDVSQLRQNAMEIIHSHGMSQVDM